VRVVFRLPAALLCLASALPSARAEGSGDLRNTELHLQTLGGKATKLAPYAGSKLTVLNLWATWCTPCRDEMPALDQIRQRYHGRGVEVVGLSVDESLATVRAYLAQHRLNYPMLWATPHKTVPALGELEGLPTTLLLDARGAVLTVFVGQLALADFTAQLEHALKPTPGQRDSRRP
jgi:thiol-disulfide isomerase/thioredoxin